MFDKLMISRVCKGVVVALLAGALVTHSPSPAYAAKPTVTPNPVAPGGFITITPDAACISAVAIIPKTEKHPKTLWTVERENISSSVDFQPTAAMLQVSTTPGTWVLRAIVADRSGQPIPTIGVVPECGETDVSVAGPPAQTGTGAVVSAGVISMTAGESSPLIRLFQPGPQMAAGALFSGQVVVELTGGLAFPGGQKIRVAPDLLSALSVPFTATSSGAVTIRVNGTILVGTSSSSVSGQAQAAVTVPAPPAPPPGPPAGKVRLITPAGTSATVGQTFQLGSLFTVEQLNQFDPAIDVKMTGGLVFTANGSQSTGASGLFVARNVLLATVRANSSGTVRLRLLEASTNSVVGEAMAVVNVPTAPAPVNPAPAPPAAPVGGNQQPTAVGKSVVVKKNTATSVVLKGTGPEGSKLTYSVLDLPANGRLTGRAPNLTYKPVSGFVGTDAFTFTVSDGVSTSEPAAVSITVTSTKAVVRKVSRKKK